MWALFLKNRQTGFTIVELLIVIVVIAILAAITIVAFNGVQDRARSSAAASSSSQAAKKIKIWQVDNEAVSPDCSKFYELVTGTTSGAPAILTPPAICGFTFKDTAYQYTPSTTTPGSYCVTTTVATRSYKVSESSPSTSGGCNGHNQGGVVAIANLITNPSFETNTTGWLTNGTNSIAMSTAQKFNGASSLLITTTGASNVGARYPFSVDSGKTYTFSGYVYFPSSFGSGLKLCIWGAPFNGNSLSCTSPVNTLNSWQRISYSAASTSAGSVNLYFYNSNNDAAIGATAYLDAVMLSEGPTLYNYADGSSANWGWSGSTHNSASTGIPL